jgi:hypothetical protein
VHATRTQSQSQPRTFGEHGRLVPLDGERVFSARDRRYFRIDQPVLDAAAVHARATEHLGAHGALLELDAFRARCDQLRASLLASPATAGLFDGVHVPFLLPARAATAADDLRGEVLGPLLDAVGRSFHQAYPKFDFRNHCTEGAEERWTVREETRYRTLLAARAQGPVAGWYFPTAMTGYAIPDQRAAVADLAPGLVLSGPLEVCAALVGTPGLLNQREAYPNLLALAAIEPSDGRFFHFFEAYGWNLTFNRRSMIGPASEYVAGGLTFFG